MLKKGCFYTSLIVIITVVSSGFKPASVRFDAQFVDEKPIKDEYVNPTLPKEYASYLNITKKINFFNDFKEALGFKESRGKYKKVNTLGYLGKYQFGIETLKEVGVNNTKKFLNNPELQEKAFVALLSKNKWELKEVIEKYDGVMIKGVLVTESGILAAAHLGGAGSVKKYFKNNGKRNVKDAYGTSIRSYMRAFGGYDTSSIVPDGNAKIM